MKWMIWRIAMVGLVLTSGFAQSNGHCTTDQQKNFPEGYQDRADRCEGLYQRKVSGTPLSFTGFGQPLGNLQWNKVSRLDLSWQAPAGKPVRLQALSLNPAVFYRMDSLRSPASGGNFQWPTQILARVGLASDQMGLAAWYETGSSDVSRVYLPVFVDGTPTGSSLEVILYPGVDLNNCLVSLQAGGSPLNLMEGRQLAKKRYPAAGAIRVSLPPNLKPGLYKFEAFAQMSTGGIANTMAALQVR